jgi:hypothetical protein
MEHRNIFEVFNNVRQLNLPNNDSSEDSSDEESDKESLIVSDYDVENNDEGVSVSENENEIAERVYYSRNEQYIWSTDEYQQVGRRNRQNIIREVDGPSPHVKPQSIDQSFNYFFTDEMLLLIVGKTNEYANEQCLNESHTWNDLCLEELKGFIGILVVMGALRGGKQSLRDFWDETFGQKTIIATMSRERFMQLLKFIRFDSHSTRTIRQKNDRLAPIRELWDLFTSNCRKNIIPSPFLCVDEQIVPTRGRCPFRIYMGNKPHKYGIKNWVLADTNGYCVDSIVYLGRKKDEPPDVNQPKNVVTNLVKRFYGSGRNVTADNFFVSIPLAEHLYANGMTLLGTVRRNKAQIPKEFVTKRPHLSSLVAYCNNMQLVSYMAKPSKCVITLSTLHNTSTFENDESKKPSSIIDYNATKYPVDMIDQMCNEFSTRRKIRRWPMTLFFHIIDTCGINAYITWLKLFPDWQVGKAKQRRQLFLKELSLELMKPWMDLRVQYCPKGAMQKRVRLAREACSTTTHVQMEPVLENEKLRGQCHLCVGKRRRIFTTCEKCHRNICKEHSSLICQKCL